MDRWITVTNWLEIYTRVEYFIYTEIKTKGTYHEHELDKHEIHKSTDPTEYNETTHS